MGKAISFSLAFPGATFFIREMAAAISSASSVWAVRMTSALSEEIAFWRFWTTRLAMSRGGWKNTWQSQSRLTHHNRDGQVSFTDNLDIVLGDFWEGHMASEGINVKEVWAVAKVLEALSRDICDCRVNVQVDNQAVIHTWMDRVGRAQNMYPVAKRIFHLTQERNLQ